MDLFFETRQQGVILTWDILINDINNSTTYNPYCKSDSYYETFKNIITSMLIGEKIILLDSDFTDSELINLTEHSNFSSYTQEIDKKSFPLIQNKRELISNLRETSKNWKITLFTSGTTGIPKKVTHNYDSITRFVKISDRNSDNIWGFAYNPTHMAGIQVFYQAVLNGNTIIKLFGLTPNEIYREIKENNITHISATPTFYRLLLPCDESFQSVRRITSGGEKFNKKTIHQLQDVFPEAKITNVYATTETGTLFASNNDIFSIKPEYKNLIRTENDELLIHNSLIGNTNTNINEWYNTGDLIEIITEDPLRFKFISRKSDMINVGGYKVNPLEVEEAILTIPEIKNVRVFPKSNSVLGNIICCEVVCVNEEISESSIRIFLQSKIQEFKIPRIIKFVDELSTTRTGKIKRT